MSDRRRNLTKETVTVQIVSASASLVSSPGEKQYSSQASGSQYSCKFNVTVYYKTVTTYPSGKTVTSSQESASCVVSGSMLYAQALGSDPYWSAYGANANINNVGITGNTINVEITTLGNGQGSIIMYASAAAGTVKTRKVWAKIGTKYTDTGYTITLTKTGDAGDRSAKVNIS